MADLIMTIEGKEVKVVPESDLLAFKGGSEKKIDDLQKNYDAQLTEAKKTADSHYQNFLKEKSSNEELIKKLSTFEPLPAKVQEVSTMFENTYKAHESLLKQHVDLKSTYLKDLYGLSDDKISGKSIDDLNTLEMGLKAAGVKPRTGGGYDTGGGGGSGHQKSGVEACADELTAVKKSMGLVV